jgi:hypothetical protein
MAKIITEKIDNWFDLTLRIDDYFTHSKGYIFRGQADAEWRLESTLARAIRQGYPQDRSKKKNWKDILFQFKANLRGRCLMDLTTADEDELWALGQHYGLHTPMLDWTWSPYVAVFFALRGECKSGKRALWAVFEQYVSSLYEDDEIVPESEQIRVVNLMTHHNPRLISQRGLFLKIPPTQSLEKRIRQLAVDDHAVMYKFVFSDQFRDDALAALDLRNINFASLFPDISGSALHSNYEFEAQKHLDEMQERGWPES